MTGPQTALLIVGLAHVGAAAVLLWVLYRSADRPLGLGWWLGEDPGGADEPADAPRPRGPGADALPLPDAAPSKVRLRGPGRLADARPLPPRRPEHVPAPERAPHGD